MECGSLLLVWLGEASAPSADADGSTRVGRAPFSMAWGVPEFQPLDGPPFRRIERKSSTRQDFARIVLDALTRVGRDIVPCLYPHFTGGTQPAPHVRPARVKKRYFLF